MLQAAAGIFGVEARHAAVVGNLLGLPAEGGVYMGAFEKPIDKATVLKDVTPFLAQMGPMPPGGGVNTGGGSTAGTEDKKLFGAGGIGERLERRLIYRTAETGDTPRRVSPVSSSRTPAGAVPP